LGALLEKKILKKENVFKFDIDENLKPSVKTHTCKTCEKGEHKSGPGRGRRLMWQNIDRESRYTVSLKRG
jgi:hypothetical protein